MRFVRLELREYGPFRDAPPIEFGDGPRLHVIQGPNEAGKSTALRAIRALLFGFPHSTDDVHDRKYEELRIAATLRGEDGSELAFTRRKATVKPLWTVDDSRAIAAGSLAPCLGGLGESRFNDLFAMDHAELVEGGRAILDGKGDLGAILFAAGSGLARFDQVSRSLDDEIGKLFKPKASNPSINASLVTLKAARDEETRSMLPTQKWADLHAELLREGDHRALADATIRSIDGKKRELENLLKALPVIRERDQVLVEIDRCQDVILLSPGFAELRLETSIDRQAALGRQDEATLSIEKSRAELEAFGLPDPVLAEAEAIGELEVGRKLYIKASRDRQAKQVKLGLIDAEVRALLADLLPGRPEATADEVRSIVARRELIRELTGEHAGLAAKAQALEDAVAATIAAHPGVLDCPNDPASAREAEALSEVLKRVGTFGDLDARRLEALAELAEADRAATLGLAALPLWSGTLDDLLALKIPMVATLDRFELDFREADDAAHRARSLVDQAEAEASNLDVEIARFRLEGEVPSLEDLIASRSDRDLAWRGVRDRWLAGDRPGESADAFEARVLDADAVADRLRLEADRVARQARLREARRELDDRIVGLKAARDRSADRRSGLQNDWQSLWAPTCIAPLSPREMKEWGTVSRANVARQADAVAKAREKVGRIDEKIELSQFEINRHLSKLVGSSAEPMSLVTLVARGRATADRVLVACRLVDDRSKLAKAEAAIDDWRSRWSAAVDALGLGLDVSASRANSVLDRLEKLLKAFEDQNSLIADIADLERSESLFINDVRAMLKRLDLSPPATNVEAEARALKARLDMARADDARRLAASDRLEADRAKLDRAQADLGRADSTLDAMALEAGCESPDGLREAERASEEARSVRARLAELDRQVATLASPIPAGRFLLEANAVDGETLKSTIDDLAAELEPIVEARTRHDRQIGGLNERLESLSVDQKAADARQSVHQSLARLSTDVERYARLKLASAVLKDAVERHRKRNQGPVLDRAGALFRALTAGSFAGLRDDLDDAGKPRLQGLRADGKTLLDVEAMSEGTADQLYLALRLASLGAYLDDHEPMPLVVDDILVNFDDARATAALRALAELAGRTQVLFFTHHDHLVDLARAALDPTSIVVHSLGANVPVVA